MTETRHRGVTTLIMTALAVSVGLTGCSPEVPAPTPPESVTTATVVPEASIETDGERIAFGRWGPTEDRGTPPALWTVNANAAQLAVVSGVNDVE